MRERVSEIKIKRATWKLLFAQSFWPNTKEKSKRDRPLSLLENIHRVSGP